MTFPTRSLLLGTALCLSIAMVPQVVQAGGPDQRLSEAELQIHDLPVDMRGKIAKPSPDFLPVAHPGPAHDPVPAPKPDPVPNVDADAPMIQIALLLDTSNSMDGLIDQAKAQLWMIVNRFAKAQRDGKQPNFQIALFEYGNTNLPAEEGYIRQVVSFTNDLDEVSQALFSLRTQGGDEYCGQVIDEALTRLPWSANANDFKAIYIAGNEPYTQGPVHYVGVSKRAVDKGVLVNTIHCGSESAGISGKWQHGAHLTGGSFLTINQDRAFVHIKAPQDEAIAKLNTQLNKTYIPYGAKGQRALERQATLDEANSKLSADAAAQRAESKASGLYQNSHWDLIDASKQKKFDLAEVPAEQLPEAMRKMSIEERRAYVKNLSDERGKIQKEIAQLAGERADYIAKDRAKRAAEEGESLGEAIEGTIDEQLEASGYEVEEAPKSEEKQEK